MGKLLQFKSVEQLCQEAIDKAKRRYKEKMLRMLTEIKEKEQV